MKREKLTNNKLWLAPLAGYTDYTFREICKENGADVLVSEMVSSEGLVRKHEKTISYMKFNDFQRPFGIQLFGSEPKIMTESALIAAQYQPDFIDINMGCPVKKVVNKGAGSALMKFPDRAANIIKSIKRELSTEIPLSAKIRSGWDKTNINAVSFARNLEQNGLDFICIHPRTRSQMFSGKSNWFLIKELKEELTIPVIGNGDIFKAEDATGMFNLTNCDSIMIGRGALGQPWIFNKIKNSNFKIDKEKRLEIIKRHIELFTKKGNSSKPIIAIRSHLNRYLKGFPQVAKAREKINKTEDKDYILKIIEDFFLN